MIPLLLAPMTKLCPLEESYLLPDDLFCQKCDAAEKRGEEAEEHECKKNFGGSSKSMEASAILKMV